MEGKIGKGRRMHKGRGKEEYGTNPLGPEGDWAAGQVRQGGGSGVRFMDTTEGVRGPGWDKHWGDRDLVTG